MTGLVLSVNVGIAEKTKESGPCGGRRGFFSNRQLVFGNLMYFRTDVVDSL